MESPPELIRKSSGKLFDQSLSINGSCLSPLLLFDDQPTDLPTASHHLGIDDLQSTASRLNEGFPDLLVNALDALVICHFVQWTFLYSYVSFFNFLPMTTSRIRRLWRGRYPFLSYLQKHSDILLREYRQTIPLISFLIAVLYVYENTEVLRDE